MKDSSNKENQEHDEENSEDVVFEQDQEGNPAEPEQVVSRLRKKLKECEKEKQEYLNGWQRAKADLINARKSDEERNRQVIKFANEELIQGIIPVLDSFDLAFSNREAWQKAPKEWRIGMESIHSQLLAGLSQGGVQILNPVGEDFDPSRDEAVESVPVDKADDDDKVLAVLQKGYSLGGKVIRSPKVRVGQLKLKN